MADDLFIVLWPGDKPGDSQGEALPFVKQLGVPEPEMADHATVDRLYLITLSDRD